MPPIGCDALLSDGVNAVPLQIYQGEGTDRPRRKQVVRTLTPSSSGLQDVAWFDWKNGFGYSQPGIVNDGYAYGLNVDTRSPGTVLPSGAITEVDTSGLGVTLSGVASQQGSFTDPLGHYIILVGRYALKFTNGAGSPSVLKDIGVGGVFYSAALARYAGGSYAWIGDGAGFSSFDGITWVRTTSFARNLTATTYWATTDGLSVQRLVAADTTHTVKHCPMTADPLVDGNWSASITVGDGTWPINSLPASGRHVYIGTIGGIYDLDDLGQTVNLAPYQGEQLNDWNNVAATVHDGFVLCGAGVGADAVDVRQPGIKQEEANWVMPGATVGIPNETPIFGRPTAFAKDSGWVVMSVFNGTDSYILYGKRRERLGFPGPGDWVWHGALAKYASQWVTHMKVRMTTTGGVTTRRLWVCTIPSTWPSSTGTRIFYQSLPLTTTPRQDAENSTAHRFATSWSLYMTPKNWDSPGKEITVVRAAFDTRDLSSTRIISLYLSSDESAYGSALATVTESPSTIVPLASSAVTGLQIAPRLDGVGTSTVPAVLRSLTLRGIVDPDPVPLFEFDVWLQRDNTLSHGGTQHHSQPEIDDQLLLGMHSQVVTYTAPDDTVYTVMAEVDAPSPLIQFESQSSPGSGASRGWGRKVTIRLRVLDEPARYGQALYNLVARYS